MSYINMILDGLKALSDLETFPKVTISIGLFFVFVGVCFILAGVFYSVVFSPKQLDGDKEQKITRNELDNSSNSEISQTDGDNYSNNSGYIIKDNQGEINVSYDDKKLRSLSDNVQEILSNQKNDQEKKDQLAESLKLSDEAIVVALAALGENNVPQSDRARLLVERAQDVKKMRSTLSDIKAIGSLGGNEVIDHILKAEKFVEKGQFSDARDSLERIGQESANFSSQMKALQAATYNAEWNYRKSFELYNEARNMVKDHNSEAYRSYLFEAAKARCNLGTFQGSEDFIKDSISLLEEFLDGVSVDERPYDWSKAQNILGIALMRLAEIEIMRTDDVTNSIKHFKASEEAHREALLGRDKKLFPREWAQTNSNLGTVLASRGQFEANPNLLEKAMQALDLSMEVYTQEAFPREWAMAEQNRGAVLASLGQIKGGDVGRYQAAEMANLNALKVFTQEKYPLDWARTKMALGATLYLLKRPDEAEVVLNDALIIFTREGHPAGWHKVQQTISMFKNQK